MALDTPDWARSLWEDVERLSEWPIEVYALAALVSETPPLLYWSTLQDTLSFLYEETDDYLSPSSLDARLLAALQRQLDALVQTYHDKQQPPQELIEEWMTTTHILMGLTDRWVRWDELRLLHRYKPEMLARHLAAINIAPEEVPQAFMWPLDWYPSEPKPLVGKEAEEVHEQLAQIRAGTLPDEGEWL